MDVAKFSIRDWNLMLLKANKELEWDVFKKCNNNHGRLKDFFRGGGQQFIYPGTGVAKDFSGGKNGEISFYALDRVETRGQLFFATDLIGNCQISKPIGGLGPLCHSLPTLMITTPEKRPALTKRFEPYWWLGWFLFFVQNLLNFVSYNEEKRWGNLFTSWNSCLQADKKNLAVNVVDTTKRIPPFSVNGCHSCPSFSNDPSPFKVFASWLYHGDHQKTIFWLLQKFRPVNQNQLTATIFFHQTRKHQKMTVSFKFSRKSLVTKHLKFFSENYFVNWRVWSILVRFD